MIFEAWETDRASAEEFDARYYADAALMFATTIVSDDPRDKIVVSVARKGFDDVKIFTVFCDWRPVLTVHEGKR